MPNPHVLLWLEAPLQSWGADSKFGRRDSLNFPSKSGIMGLVCCALGAGGAQRALLAEFAELNQTVLSFVRQHPLKEDAPPKPPEPLLCDFHMVGSGYDDKDPWLSLLIPKTSDGKKAVGGGTKMTYRYYLQDAAFAVALEVPAPREAEIVEALQNPVWDVYLGRKACAPTDIIFRGVFVTEADALSAAHQIAVDKHRTEHFRVYHGALPEGEADAVFTLNDVAVEFGERKRYRDRQVSVCYV